MSAKELFIKIIESKTAKRFIDANHYSKRTPKNSPLNFGVFWKSKLEGVLSFGNCFDKSKLVTLVKETEWNGFTELIRIVFTDKLPKNSESRAISICLKIIKKSNPHIKWVVTFADACLCGDGTIFRASGFVLTAINKSKNLFIDENKKRIDLNVFKKNKKIKARYKNDWDLALISEFKNPKPIPGFNLRYIFFIDKSFRKNLNVKDIPFVEIKNKGASMYKGKRAQVA